MSNKTYYLQQLSIEKISSKPLSNTIKIEEVRQNHAATSQQFYLEVGQHWQWNDKRQWSEQDWLNYIQSKAIRTFAAYQNEQFVGYFELEKHSDGSVEIAYFGLAKCFLGQGIGGGLLSLCLHNAWQWQASRVWVHTCDLDHPSALANYQARGMELYKTECDS